LSTPSKKHAAEVGVVRGPARQLGMGWTCPNPGRAINRHELPAVDGPRRTSAQGAYTAKRRSARLAAGQKLGPQLRGSQGAKSVIPRRVAIYDAATNIPASTPRSCLAPRRQQAPPCGAALRSGVTSRTCSRMKSRRLGWSSESWWCGAKGGRDSRPFEGATVGELFSRTAFTSRSSGARFSATIMPFVDLWRGRGRS